MSRPSAQQASVVWMGPVGSAQSFETHLKKKPWTGARGSAQGACASCHDGECDVRVEGSCGTARLRHLWNLEGACGSAQSLQTRGRSDEARLGGQANQPFVRSAGNIRDGRQMELQQLERDTQVHARVACGSERLRQRSPGW